MTYAAWEPRCRCTTVAPGKLDLFVVTLVEGRLAALDTVMDYEAALERARGFHRDNPCQIKVLPMTGEELRNYLGIELPKTRRPMTEAERKMVHDRMTNILRDSNDADARADALDLMSELGMVAR